MTWQTKAWRTPSARQERLDNGMSEWCFQCGVEQRPQRAVGWDEEGEPACSGHAKRATTPLKLDRPAEVEVAETPVSVHSYPGQFVNEEEVEEAAAPSPVQTSAVEVVMADRICSGYKKQCTNSLRPGSTTGLCSACYARRKYHESKAGAPAVVAPSKQPKTKTEPLQIQPATEPSLGSTEAGWAVHMTNRKLNAIWALLSVEQKAHAIDHILEIAV